MNQTIAEAIKAAADLLSLLLTSAKESQAMSPQEGTGADPAAVNSLHAEIAELRNEVRFFRESLVGLNRSLETALQRPSFGPVDSAQQTPQPAPKAEPHSVTDPVPVKRPDEDVSSTVETTETTIAPNPKSHPAKPPKVTPKTSGEGGAATKKLIKAKLQPSYTGVVPPPPAEATQVPRRKPGRPPGSKNKPKSETGAPKQASDPEPATPLIPQIAVASLESPPGGDLHSAVPGNNHIVSPAGPPRSNSSVTLVNDPGSCDSVESRGRGDSTHSQAVGADPGRREGSENSDSQSVDKEFHPIAERPAEEAAQNPVKRRPGRPPGAKDKVKRKSPRDRSERDDEAKLKPRKMAQEVPPLPRLIVPEDDHPAINYLESIDPNAVAIPAFALDPQLISSLDMSMVNPGSTWTLYTGRDAYHDEVDDQIFIFKP